MDAELSSRVSMPLDIEAVAAYPVQASERSVEFFGQGFRLIGSIALDEPIAVPVPFAEDIDWVVELSGADCRQDTQHIGLETLNNGTSAAPQPPTWSAKVDRLIGTPSLA